MRGGGRFVCLTLVLLLWVRGCAKAVTCASSKPWWVRGCANYIIAFFDIAVNQLAPQLLQLYDRTHPSLPGDRCSFLSLGGCLSDSILHGVQLIGCSLSYAHFCVLVINYVNDTDSLTHPSRIALWRWCLLIFSTKENLVKRDGTRVREDRRCMRKFRPWWDGLTCSLYLFYTAYCKSIAQRLSIFPKLTESSSKRVRRKSVELKPTPQKTGLSTGMKGGTMELKVWSRVFDLLI